MFITKHEMVFLIFLAATFFLINAVDNEAIKKSSEIKMMVFPNSFKFGAASAAYQIEGGWNADGKGPSIWDTFTHKNISPIDDKSNGDVGANSYALYLEDIKALKTLNSEFYRFSVSWPRVLPNGKLSSRNQAGIDYYHRLIDALIENGIEPMITMFHWDMPQALQDEGGFSNEKFIDYFEEYADLLYSEYGNKIKTWFTFNEPVEYCGKGYAEGIWPPSIRSLGIGDYLCTHITVLAHARAYHLYKDKYFKTQQGRVGMVVNSGYYYPKDPNNETHVAAAERGIQFRLGIYVHPITIGGYPKVVRDQVDGNSAKQGFSKSRLPILDDVHIEYLKGTSDFIGLNYYTSRMVEPPKSDDFNEMPSIWHDTYINAYTEESWPRAKSDWLFSKPDGLRDVLKWIRDNYNNIEVIITENGWSDDGELDDQDRIKYMKDHFIAIHEAIEDGCNVTGHTSWSIIDNFEWSRGYTEKFGLYRVDVNDHDLKRVPKSSVKYLSEIFKTKTMIV